jgi:hypothetical protein
MAAEAAAMLRPWCTNVVVGKDLISRLNMDTFHRLRTDMITARRAAPLMLALAFDTSGVAA